LNTESPESAASAAGAATPRLRRYQSPNTLRSVVELAITAAPLILLWGLAWATLHAGHWWGLLFTVPAGAFLVRLFMVQHDCGHGAFFRQKALNDWVGRAIGVFTLTPYDHWRKRHALHHATAGDLDRRGFGDVDTLTVEEYLALPWPRRLGYRLYRHPAVMFVLGPTYVFLITHRLPLGEMTSGWRPWLSTMGTNLAIAAIVVGMMLLVGARTFLLVQAPITLTAAAIGVWLFYIQHQYEGVVWVRSPNWSLREAAISGSSHYHLPGPLGWITANIGVHHVHHLSSRIPFYRLRQVLRDYPELDGNRLTVGQSLRGVGLALWDEARQKLISFRDLRGKPRRADPLAAS